MANEEVSPWRKLSSSVYSNCKVYKILKERWEHPIYSSSGDFYVMEVGDWGVAIALTENNSCVMVRQFRFGSESLTWELPAGVIDPGEDPDNGAARELYEESGYRGRNPRLIGSTHPNPAIQRNQCHFILFDDAVRTGVGDPGPHEFFEVKELPVDQLFEWARNGSITHGIVHTALFFLREYLESGRLDSN